MPDVNVYEAFKELIQRLLGGDEEVAELAATDPEGLLAAYGITEASLDGVDFRQAVEDCYHDYELGDGTKQALQSYVAGGSAPDHYQVKSPPAAEAHQSPEHAVQHLQYVTYATYETNENITREIVNKQFNVDNSDNRVFNLDNSTDVAVDVGRNFDGDITVAPTTAAGDGAVANTGDDNVFGTGEGDVLAASRGGEVTAASEGSVIGNENIVSDGDGDILNATRGGEINAATGDGAVQGERLEAVNTGELDGIQAGRDVENAVLGDDNQTANLDISAGSGSGGDASGTSGDATGGGLGDSRNDLFEDARQDNSTESGDGTGGEAGDGTGGSVGPVNLNFGSGDQATTNVEGDVRNSALSAEGDADNALNADARFASQEAGVAQEAELVEESVGQEIVELEPAVEELDSGSLEAEVSAGEAADVDSAVEESVSG